MTALPDEVTYGTVTATLTQAQNNPADPTGEPISVPCTGSVTFAATPAKILSQSSTPPLIILPAPITVALDSDGALSVDLIATDDDSLSPSLDWTWVASFALGNSQRIDSFAFNLPGGTTVDLAAVTPVDQSAGVITIRGPKGDQGEQGIQGIQGIQGPAGPAGLSWDDDDPNWDAGKQYAIRDAVYYDGSSYWAIAVPTIGQAPSRTLSTPWMELAIMGQTGPPGSDHLYMATNDDGTLSFTTDGDQSYPSTTLWAGTVSGAFTPDLTSGVDQEWTLTGAVTLTLPTPDMTAATVTLSVSIVQDSTGGRAITWDTAIKWTSGIAPVLPTAAGSESDVILRWSPNLGWRGYVGGAAMAVGS